MSENKQNKDIEKTQEDSNTYKDTNKKSKQIQSLILATSTLIVGLVCGFYVGKDASRGLPATYKTYPKNQVLAKIDDVELSGDDFAKRMEPFFYSQGLKKLSNEEIETQEVNTINYMTNLEALYKAGKEDGIEFKDEEVEENYISTISSIGKSFNLTEGEFLKKFDLTKDYIKRNLEKEMVATKYLEDNSEVSDKEAQTYYDNNKEAFFQVEASHILISTYNEDGTELSESEKQEKKELAQKVLNRALAGDSFDDLALENSDDTYNASNGGQLGYFSKGQMDPKFEDAAFALKDNEISKELVESSYGYHIIKKTGEKYVNFEEEKLTIKDNLILNKQNMLLEDALDKYNVKINM